MLQCVSARSLLGTEQQRPHLAPGTAGRGKDDDGEDGDSPRNLGPVSLKPCPTARAWAPEARNMRWVAP